MFYFLKLCASASQRCVEDPSWAADLVKARKAQNGKDDPTSHCLPGGIAKLHTSALLRKVVQTPGLILFLTERNASYRQIFLDGRPLPNDPDPSWNGYSTGQWEGDTLVVETIGLRGGQWLDRAGSPLTDAARITEKFRRPTFGTMEIEMTVNDPKAYTAPWTIQLSQGIMLNTDLLDYICLENEKDDAHLVGKLRRASYLPITLATNRSQNSELPQPPVFVWVG